jgi:hypothetical protein
VVEEDPSFLLLIPQRTLSQLKNEGNDDESFMKILENMSSKFYDSSPSLLEGDDESSRYLNEYESIDQSNVSESEPPSSQNSFSETVQEGTNEITQLSRMGKFLL